MTQDPRTTWMNQAKAAADRLWSYSELVDDFQERADQAFHDGDDPIAFVKWLGEKHDLIPASSSS